MSCFIHNAQIFSLLSLRPSIWSPERLLQHHLWSSNSLCCVQVWPWFDIHNAPQNIYTINHQYICAVLIVKLSKPPLSLLNKPCVFKLLPPVFKPFWTLTVFALHLQEEEERGKRQVLVLGLDGAGKSSMLQGLTPGEPAAKRGRCRPTRGFNFMSLNAPACQLDFLESKTPFIPRNQTKRALCVKSRRHLYCIK